MGAFEMCRCDALFGRKLFFEQIKPPVLRHSLGTISHAQFTVNIAGVFLDHLWRNNQFIGDLAVGKTSGQQA